MLTKDLSLVFQPIVNLVDGTVIGHEALVRGRPGSDWEYPRQIFEQARAENRLQEIERQCRHLAFAAAARVPPGQRLYVNIHVFPEDAQEFSLFGADPSRVVIELSEEQALVQTPQLLKSVQRLRAMGLTLALDDYGMGYANASTLLTVEPHAIKLDRYFIGWLRDHKAKRDYVASLVQWFSELNVQIIAEGIETGEDLEEVQKLGIVYGQGFFWGHPEAGWAAPRLPVELSRLR